MEKIEEEIVFWQALALSAIFCLLFVIFMVWMFERPKYQRTDEINKLKDQFNTHTHEGIYGRIKRNP